MCVYGACFPFLSGAGVCQNVCCVAGIVNDSVFLALEC